MKLFTKRSPSYHNQHAKKVADYYDNWHNEYMKVYGPIIQSYRPSSTSDLLDYLEESMGLADGMRILDAGCGVCMPAIHFANHYDLSVDGITISKKQVKEGKRQIKKHGAQNRVTCTHGDFHELDSIFPPRTYDGVIFLEALGHAGDPHTVLTSAANVLKTGGFIYIKDFFPCESDDQEFVEATYQTAQNINEEYCYNVLDLHDTITTLRKAGFVINFIQEYDFDDDISIRKEFESHYNAATYAGGKLEWLEIKCEKRYA
jgi:cyclopropane fatty-acyl-phospholipid synthase-like methyltransferase